VQPIGVVQSIFLDEGCLLSLAAVHSSACVSDVQFDSGMCVCSYCRKSADIRPLAIMAVSAGVASNVLEFAWKMHLSKWLTTPELITGFMAKVATCAGAATLCLIPLASVAFQHIGWSRTAKATPNLLLAAGVPFFLACVTYQAFKHFNAFVPLQDPLLMGISVRPYSL
jgi:ATP/ADP translocase